MDEDSAQATDRLYLVGVGVVVFLEAVDEARHDLLTRVLTVAHHHDQSLVLATRQQTQCHRHVNTTTNKHSVIVMSTRPSKHTALPSCQHPQQTLHRAVSSKLRCSGQEQKMVITLAPTIMSD